MEALLSCTEGTLSPYVPSADKPWDSRRAQHVLRRTGFGASPADLKKALLLSPSASVDQILDDALALPLPPPPPWAELTLPQYTNFPVEAFEQGLSWVRLWIKDMIRFGFREKLALFWHNHFVTQAETFACPSYLYQYHKLLQQHALGNFKTFVKAMGTTPAMLVFLNGVQNNRFSPNENYARELLELFTLGRDNGYTQEDIKQVARALTGWISVPVLCGPIGFAPFFFDDGQKTIFGKTGAWNYESLHDLLFAERSKEIARYICTKLYRHFVHPQPNEEIINGMAKTFLDNQFEIAPVLRELFKSEHFFSDPVVGVQIKSPMELILGFIKDGQFAYDTEEILNGIYYLGGLLGQQLFQPPDVAGWPGNRAWINSDTLNGRWDALDIYLFLLYTQQPETLRSLAKTLASSPNDPSAITSAITGFFLPNGLQHPADYDRAAKVLKHEVPQNYYDSGQWNLDWDIAPAQVALLIQYLYKLPDFQLT